MNKYAVRSKVIWPFLREKTIYQKWPNNFASKCIFVHPYIYWKPKKPTLQDAFFFRRTNSSRWGCQGQSKPTLGSYIMSCCTKCYMICNIACYMKCVGHIFKMHSLIGWRILGLNCVCLSHTFWALALVRRGQTIEKAALWLVNMTRAQGMLLGESQTLFVTCLKMMYLHSNWLTTIYKTSAQRLGTAKLKLGPFRETCTIRAFNVLCFFLTLPTEYTLSVPHTNRKRKPCYPSP